jgi:FkbM family methyltransferase
MLQLVAVVAERPTGLRAPRSLRALVGVAWPVRWYWAHSKRQLGKRLLVDHFLKRLLPAPPIGFEAELQGGGRVFVHHRDDVGLVLLMTGTFEPAETACALEFAREGTVAIDIGANIGMFTVPLASAVGPRGRVLAIEPAHENVEMLAHNIDLNGFENVEIREIAVAAEDGEVLLQLGNDPAFHSTTTVVKARATEDQVVVRAESLDSVWATAGSPEVSFLKIDTEGGELEILESARLLLAACQPAILVEAKGAKRIQALEDCLAPFGYVRTRRRGFAPGNHLCVAREPT